MWTITKENTPNIDEYIAYILAAPWWVWRIKIFVMDYMWKVKKLSLCF